MRSYSKKNLKGDQNRLQRQLNLAMSTLYRFRSFTLLAVILHTAPVSI